MSALLGMFTTPHQLTGLQHLLLLCPLCVAISLVYKALRCQDLHQVPLAALGLSVTIIVAMFGVGVGVWLLYVLLA